MQNTERTFILGNNDSLKLINGTYIEIPIEQSLNDSNIHEWIVQIFSEREVEQIVIEIGKNIKLSLLIAYHLRLCINELKKSVLAPILFVSNYSLNTIISEVPLFSQIIGTKGVYFSEINVKIIEKELENIQEITPLEYINNFLKVINIQQDEKVGRHSIANIWGAYVMSKASGLNVFNDNLSFKKDLYFKFVNAFNQIETLKPSSLKILGNISLGKSKKINAIGKKIILIDDEAHKGWGEVLKKIFITEKEDDFVIISEKVKDFESLSEESKNILDTKIFDLYLIDLRLNGLDEESTIKVQDFSGLKILKKIKELNQGYQVISFTASNKAWNFKALLDAGADGYYMKESPEYGFTSAISEQNYFDFKEKVEKCFSNSYLKNIYSELKYLKNLQCINIHKIDEYNVSLDIAWEQIKNRFLDFGFLTLFQIIERYADSLFFLDEATGDYYIENHIAIENSQIEKKWKLEYQEDKKNGSYFLVRESKQDSKIQPTTLFKVTCLLYFCLNKKELQLRDFGRLNRIRNEIAHRGNKSFCKIEDINYLLSIIKEIYSR